MDISSLPVTELTSAGILVVLLQYLKRTPLLEKVGGWGYRAISIVWALVSTIIVGMEWSGALETGGTLTVVLPGISGVLIALWHWLSNFTIQEIVYQVGVKKNEKP